MPMRLEVVVTMVEAASLVWKDSGHCPQRISCVGLESVPARARKWPGA